MIVAVLGAGQLGRMLALAGAPLGVRCRCWSPTPAPRSEPFSASAAAQVVVGDLHDRAVRAQVTAGADVVTYEFEHLPTDAVELVAQGCPVQPGVEALRVTQDRRVEKETLDRLGAPVAAWRPIDHAEQLRPALAELGDSAILKRRHHGYDGKGQCVIEADGTDLSVGRKLVDGGACVLERKVVFRRELSILLVAGADGRRAAYPLVENEHVGGILRRSIAPAPDLDPRLQARAEEIAGTIADDLDYRGVLAVELFETQNGELLVNELAPRVHNSGHWTIEGAVTSQFENHLRAVLGVPIGSTKARGSAVMLNLIGHAPKVAESLSTPTARVHMYGKTPRTGRKLGHVTFTAPTHEDALAQASEFEALLADDAARISPA